MRLRFAFCGMLLATANVYAGERQDGLDWLKTVAFAAHQTDYSGVFVYQYGNRVETSRITHVLEADSEYEKMESLDGPKREIIRHDGQVWCYVNHRMVQVDSQQGRSRFPSLLPEQLSALSGNYQATEEKMERVAGYNTQVVLFQPKDNLRYAHKIWVHTDSGLLLKSAVLGDKNQLVEQYAFTQLQIGGNIDRSWIRLPPSSADLPGGSTSPEHDASTGLHATESSAPPETAKGSAPINSGWVVDILPTGFKKIMEIQRPMRGKRVHVTQLVFSDGLSAISVFVEPVSGDLDDVEGLSSRGAVNLYQKIVDKYLLTVVGEVPPHTVMQVLDSVRYKGQ